LIVFLEQIEEKMKDNLMENVYYEGVPYRDPFSLDINSFEYNYSVNYILITQSDKRRPDILFFDMYGNVEYEYLVVWLNGYSSMNEVEIGTELIFPDKRDLDNFFLKSVK